MKKNNKILNKIITGFLAFAMVITGAMSLGTMKKHTASADTQDFISLMLADMLDFIGNSKACVIFDNELIPGVVSGSKFNTVEGDGGEFLASLAQELGISCTPTAFRRINFYVFVQSDNNNDYYVDLMNGNMLEFSFLVDYGIANIGENSIDFSTDTSFFGVMSWTTNQEIIDYYKEFKNELGDSFFPVFAYEKEGLYDDNDSPDAGPTGENQLQVKYYAHLYENFVDLTV